MKVKVYEATPRQLDWLVATIEGLSPRMEQEPYPNLRGAGVKPVFTRTVHEQGYAPFEITQEVPDFSTAWMSGGPLLDKYTILPGRGPDSFLASTNKYWWPEELGGTEQRSETWAEGGTMLAACMRCLVTAVMGTEVDVPEELA